jgi:hypothetical protein
MRSDLWAHVLQRNSGALLLFSPERRPRPHELAAQGIKIRAACQDPRSTRAVHLGHTRVVTRRIACAGQKNDVRAQVEPVD